MRHLLTILAALWLPATLAAAEMPYRIPGATEQSVTSGAGEAYRVFVYVPGTPPPPSGFPVLYVLDGEDNFPIAVSIARRLARAAARSGVEPGIVIGIDAGDLRRRAFDYTPDFGQSAIKEGQPGYGLPTGGADAFLDFLSNRLQPALARDLRLDASRTTIAGHSFGGVLALHALMTRPQQFCHHVAASPSLWLADGALFNRIDKLAGATEEENPGRLLITVGEKEDYQSVLRFAERLKEKRIDLTVRTLVGEGHGATMPTSMTDAVNVAFKGPGCRVVRRVAQPLAR